MRCWRCRRRGYLFRCRHCNKYFCDRHRLPEDHHCRQFRRGNIFKNLKNVEISRIEEKEKPIVRKTNIFQEKLFYIKSWLKGRSHQKYNYSRIFTHLLKNFIVFIILAFLLMLLWSNKQYLNTLLIWFIPVGWLAIIITAFFTLKFLWETTIEIPNWYKRQQKWLKILLVCLIIFLLWRGYIQRDSLMEKLNASPKIHEFIIQFNETINPQKNETSPSLLEEVFYGNPERHEECMQAFNELDGIRQSYEKPYITWDERAYKLAVARSKDMYDREYFDHVTPEGKCVDNFKQDYGFKEYEFVAENAGGMRYYSKGRVAGNCEEALNGWLDSRGHRYNLLYSGHVSGAIGCYYEICVFLGVNYDGFGAMCSSGAEGLAYWQSASQQPGEV